MTTYIVQFTRIKVEAPSPSLAIIAAAELVTADPQAQTEFVQRASVQDADLTKKEAS